MAPALATSFSDLQNFWTMPAGIGRVAYEQGADHNCGDIHAAFISLGLAVGHKKGPF
jgi:hypothetical protein